MKNTVSKVMNERGSAGMKALIALVILVVIVYAGFQLVPIYWDHWNFQDHLETRVQFAFVNYPNNPDKELADEIYRLLDDMGAQYQKKDVKVTVDPSKKKIIVEVWYWRSHNLPLYPNPKAFYLKIENTPIS